MSNIQRQLHVVATPAGWQEIRRQNITSKKELCKVLQLSPPLQEEVLEHPAFPLNIPLRLAEKMCKNTLDDPLVRQFVPLCRELIHTPGFTADPLQELQCRQGGKLLRKYDSRALLLLTSACAVHCRYCFRKNFPYSKESPGAFSADLATIRQDHTLKEVILSGGDPLSLSNARLARLLDDIAAIPHLRRLRVHTRFPIGIPERIDDDFLRIVANSRLQVWVVIHCNHPRELDMEVCHALKRIANLGIPVLNQAVLLKGVNDCIETLVTLAETLVDHGFFFYYLHQLDQVRGTAHFAVPIEEGKALLQGMRERLSGYAVPQYVQEIPGQLSKTVLI